MSQYKVEIRKGQIWESKKTPGKYILINHISINTIDSIDFAYRTVFYFHCSKEGEIGLSMIGIIGKLPEKDILKTFRVVNDQEVLIGMLEKSISGMTDGF